MREIKFKAQWADDKTGQKHWSYYGIGGKPHVIGGHWVTDDLQYVGKGYDGQEIYEDDLILGQIWNWQTARVFRVHYDEASLTWFPFNEQHGTAEGDENLEPYMCEVVGTYAESPKTVKAPELGKWRSANRKLVIHEVEIG